MTPEAKKLGEEPVNSCEVSCDDNGIREMQTGVGSFISFGLTKREYFAALAMQVILNNAPSCKDLTDILGIAENTTKWSVLFADALLEELSKLEQ